MREKWVYQRIYWNLTEIRGVLRMRGVDSGVWRNLKGFRDWGRLGLMKNSKNSL